MADNTLRFNFLVNRNELPGAAARNETALTRLASRTSSFGKMAAVALGGAAIAAGGMATAGIVMGIKTAASMEQAQIGFTALLGSSQKAGDYLQWLKNFAAATPFEFKGLVESSRLLIGVGQSTQQTKVTLQAFGDTASAVGIDADAFSRVMLALSQSISAGHIKLGDMNQLMDNGIPIWKLMSEAMGKPVPELQKLISKGTLLTADVLPKLQAQMEKDYGGAMAKQSQTLAGLWSTLMDTLNLGLASVIQPLLPALKTLATEGIGFLGVAFQKLPGLITAGMSGLTSLQSHLPRIDVARMFGDAKSVGARVAAVLLPAGAAVLAAAQVWGGRILTGITTGLHAGNWGPLGKTIGDGLSQALAGLASGGAKLASAFSSWFASIDWLNVGKTVGAQAIPFAIGFVNSLLDGLFTTVRKHPMDVLLFAALFIPLGKLASAFGPLRSAIEHLPLGSWFLWLLDHTAAPVFDAVKKFLGVFFTAFKDGFASEFPGVAKSVSGFFRGIGDEIGLRALYAADAAKQFVAGIGDALGSGAGQLVKAAGSLIADMLRPFARPGTWLVTAGAAAVGGLVVGIVSVAGAVGRAIGGVVGSIGHAFAGAGSWLVHAGSAAVGGLVSGWDTVAPHLAIALGHTIDGIKVAFAPAYNWLIKPGVNVVMGLVHGMDAVGKTINAWISSKISQVIGFFGRAGSWLYGHGRDVISGLIGGMTDVGNGINRWLTGHVLNPVAGFFGRAGSWLFNAGYRVIGGFLSGAESLARTVTGWIRGHVYNPIAGYFKGAFNWVWNGGYSLISGLFSGIRSALGNVGNWVSAHITGPIIHAVKWFFGIKSPSTVFAGIGSHLVGGLLQGMLRANPGAIIGKVFGGMPNALSAIVNKGLLSIGSLPAKALSALSLFGGTSPTAGGGYGHMSFPFAVGGGAAQWAGLVSRVLTMEGLSPLLLGKVLRQIQTESGGNPNALQGIVDINSLMGQPARGLLQVIPPTFAAFHWPGTSNNIMDPLANVAAALNYARHRYGSDLSSLGEGHGYDTGGVARGAGWWWKGPKPERILSPAQTQSFDQLVRSLDRTPTTRGPMTPFAAASGTTIVNNITLKLDPSAAAFEDKLIATMDRVVRQGRLTSIMRRAVA